MKITERIINLTNSVYLSSLSVLIFLCAYDRRYIKMIFFVSILCFIFNKFHSSGRQFIKNILINNLQNKAIVLFFIILVFSIIFSGNPYHSQKIFFARYFFYLMFFILGLDIAVNLKNRIKFIFYALMFSSGFMGLGGFFDYFITLPHPECYRLWSVFGIFSPFNMLPFFLSCFIPFNLAVALFYKEKKWKILSCINLFILTLCFIWQQCRSAFGAVLAGLLVIGVIKGRKVLFKGFIIMTLLLLVGSLTSVSFKERVLSVTSLDKWNNRLPLYESAFKIFKDHPIVGAGLGMFEKLIKTPKYELGADYPNIDLYRNLFIHAHNTYLEIAAETGILGLMSFIMLFIVFYKNFFTITYKKDYDYDFDYAMLIGFAGIIMSSLVFAIGCTIITVGVGESALFWLVFGLACGIIQRKIKENREGYNG